MAKRITTTEETAEDIRLEGSLRPQYLSEYIGQTKVKSTMKVYIDAAKKLLGQLYDADQLNVSVDLEMLRRMMAADGLLQEQEDINSVQTDHHPS